MKEEVLKVFEDIFDDNTGSAIEPDVEFHIETIFNVTEEHWIIPSATSDFESSNGESIHETPKWTKKLIRSKRHFTACC